MAIDRSGGFWKGTHLYDVAEYLEMAAVLHRVVQPICNCGSRRFRLRSDYDLACVQTTCPNCGIEGHLRANDEQWQEADLSRDICPCGCELFQLGLGVEQAADGTWRWTILGEWCDSCGMLSYSANCCENAPHGAAGPIGSFVDVEHAPEILRAYPLQLYEVIYYGGSDEPDVLYLVSAKDFAGARDMVGGTPIHWDRQGEKPLPDVVHEIGIDQTAKPAPRILRGPYFETGYTFGSRSWSRNAETNDWKQRED